MSTHVAWLLTVTVVLLQAFAADLARIYADIEALDIDVMVASSQTGQGLSASMAMDDAKVNQLLLKVGRIVATCCSLHGMHCTPQQMWLLRWS